MTDAVDAIDAYLAQLSHHLTVDATTRAMILEEARSHLAAMVTQRMEGGVDQTTAGTSALAAFGSAARVAARYNAVHPLAWDGRRFLIGILWGIGLSWLIWTATTFPFLVQRAIQERAAFPGSSVDSPGMLLFTATPLAFGLMRVTESEGLWILLPLLGLFGVVPLLWGWRAQRGWQPGLAFGLGVIVGFPWLLPGLIYYWGNGDGSPLSLLLIVFVIWLLCPYAMLMSWLGQRLAMARARQMSFHAAETQRQRSRDRYGRTIPYMAFAVIMVVLVAVNIWSWQRTAQLTLPPVATQLTTAQANLTFSLRQPTYLPPHFILKQVTVSTADQFIGHCSQCYVTLEYQGDNGDSITLNEWQLPPSTPPLPYGFGPPISGYAIENGSVGGSDPVWWLGLDIKQIDEIHVTWMRNGVSYSLDSQSSSSALSDDLLKQIAASV